MIVCPKCGCAEWKAIESGTWLVSTDLFVEDGELIIEMDPMAEFMHEAIASLTIAYTCGKCDYSITADRVDELKESTDA
jgi:predicted nucleic-acid-binding Zn-ribbon protein